MKLQIAAGYIGMLLLLGSCMEQKAFYVHTPAKVCSPGIRDSGDIKLDVSGKLQHVDLGSGSPLSLSVDAAWSPVYHLGIFASYRGVNNRAQTWIRTYGALWGYQHEVQVFTLDGSAADIAVGYYARTGETTKFEAYGGYGRGYLTNVSTNSDPGYYHVTYNRFFAQAAFGFEYDILSLMAGSRLSFEKYARFDHGANTYFSGTDSNMYYRVINRVQPYLDPYMEMQLGGRHIKFSLQLGYDFSLHPAPNDVVFRTSGGYVTLGLAFQLHPAARAKRPTEQ